MSPTPRTSSLLAELFRLRSHTLHYPCETQLTHLCKELETENVALSTRHASFLSSMADIAAECFRTGQDESLCREEGRKWRTMARRIAGMVYAEKHGLESKSS